MPDAPKEALTAEQMRFIADQTGHQAAAAEYGESGIALGPTLPRSGAASDLEADVQVEI